MGEEETKTEVPEPLANGTSLPEKSGEAIAEKTEEENNCVKEMEEDKKDAEKVETERMDKDKPVEEDKESKDELEKVAKGEAKTEAMEEESNPKENDKKVEKEENKDEVEEKVDGLKEEEEEKVEESKEEKGSKKCGKVQNTGEKVKGKTKRVEEKKEEELKTPLTDRPVRERKSVERLVASFDKDTNREFQIEKGRGTPLKDIPNVAFKLSRRKTDDTFKLLHTILFGRRGKAVQIKSNISRFSGFVWHENEEKQKIKVKEKFDKFNKEKLLEFCDVLDIPITKATTRKEDIVAKLIDFLEAPNATTTVLLAEKDKSSKKRKRVAKSRTTSKRSTKSRRKSGDTPKSGKKSTPEFEDESEEEEEKEEEENEEEGNENGVTEESEDEMPEKSESEEKNKSEDDSEEDVGKKKKSTKVSSTRKESSRKAKTHKVTIPKSTTPQKRTPKTTSKSSKADEDGDKSPKVSSRKKTEKVTKEKSSTPMKSASNEKTRKKVAKVKDKPKQEKLKPSDYELRAAICEILKEVDFNTATFTDILKQLAQKFDTDLIPRKLSIKRMIQEELTKLADDADDEDEDGEGDAEKDVTQSVV